MNANKWGGKNKKIKKEEKENNAILYKYRKVKPYSHSDIRTIGIK